jgi:hypothetical protein
MSILFVAFGFVALIVIVVVVVVILLLAAKRRAGRMPSKVQLVSEELQNVFGAGVHYEPNGSLTNDPLVTGLIDTPAKPKKSNDHIYGQYKGLDFERADVSFEDLRKVYDTSRHEDNYEWVTFFSGQWLVVRTQKTIPGKVLIFSKAACAWEKMLIERLQKDERYTEVILEEAAFGEFFTIFAEDPHAAFYVLTPPVMERLKRLTGEGVVNQDPDMRLYVGFYGGMIHVGIGGIHDAFEGAIMLSVNEAEARTRIRNDMLWIVYVIESLL